MDIDHARPLVPPHAGTYSAVDSIRRQARSVVRITVFTLPLAGILTGCTWIPSMITQGFDAATTVAEHRSLYTTAQDYSIRSEIRSKFGDESLLLDITTAFNTGRLCLTVWVTPEGERTGPKKSKEWAGAFGES